MGNNKCWQGRAGLQNDAATCENSLVIKYNSYHLIVTSTPRYVLPRIENLHAKKNLYTNIQSNIVYKSQKLSTTDGWMDKQKMANSWDEISSARKRMKH